MQLFIKCPGCGKIFNDHELDIIEAQIERRINNIRLENKSMKEELKKWESGERARAKC